MARGYPDYGRVSARQRFSQDPGAHVEEQKITVLAGVPEGTPTSQNFVLYKGEIGFIEVRFPSGPSGLLHIALYDADGTTKLWPKAAGAWYAGDAEAVEIETEFTINAVASVYKLVLKGYNEDITYDHSAKVRAWVIPYPA